MTQEDQDKFDALVARVAKLESQGLPAVIDQRLKILEAQVAPWRNVTFDPAAGGGDAVIGKAGVILRPFGLMPGGSQF